MKFNFNVSLPPDENGHTGRVCPCEDCEGYFKIVFGTGLQGVTACHCPYCGRTAEQSDFDTKEQVEYSKSVAFRKIGEALAKDMKAMEFNIKARGPFGIGVSMKYKPGRPTPIRHYREKALETHVECSNCTLKYAIYGVFAFCPDCRQHNSVQILDKNLEMARKMLDLAATIDGEMAERLIENALEDCVSSFDGFGREMCRLHATRAVNPDRATKISFQNVEGARENVLMIFGIDLKASLVDEEWNRTIRGSQKRHLLAHKMGVVDEEYVRKASDPQAVVGRRVSVGMNEVRDLVDLVGKMARHLSRELMKREKGSSEQSV